MTRVRIGSGRLGRRSLHPAHVVTGVRISRRRGGWRDAARLRRSRARLGRGPRPDLRRAGGRGVSAVAPVALGDGGTGGQHQGQNRDSGEQGAAHRAAPSSGRTVTTLNIPACMCISKWQWKAQSPGALAVRSNVTLPPGATLTVCFSG